MWRTLSKIRKSFETYSKTPRKPDGSALKSLKASRPVLSCLSVGHQYKEDEKQQHRAHHGANQYFQLKHDWLDAVGWSGVVLLSWYICQSHRCRRLSPNPAERYAYQRLDSCVGSEYGTFVQSITNIVLNSASKHNVLPSVNAIKPAQKEETNSEAEFDKNLQKACENLEKAHHTVTHSLANFLGTECMQNGQHDEAFSYFTEAASHENVAAIFNLGICYEMGLGTKQSFRKAANLYKKASDLGHATAMYNLGVFHVHGWGDVEADVVKARQLFTQAASLGQPDAQKAVKMDSAASPSSDTDSEDDELTCFQGTPVEEPKSNDLTELWFKMLNINLDSTVYETKNRLSSVDSGVSVNNDEDVVFLHESLSMK